MNTLPRIAVLIAAYNSEASINATLESLQKNAEPHDVILVDDGSPVPLSNVVAPQENLHLICLDENVGVTKATNIGLDYIYAKGYELLARIDADDRSAPERLEVQRRFMDANPEVVMCGSFGRVVSEEGAVMFHLHFPTEHKKLVRSLFYNSNYLHPSMMIRTESLRKAGGYDASFARTCLDYELIRRMTRYGKIANIPQYLIDYTYSTQGISVSKRRKQMMGRLQIQWKYREFGNPHFYAGLAKTFLLWGIPLEWITKVKCLLPKYRTRAT